MDIVSRKRSEMINSAINHISESAIMCKQYLDEREIPIFLQQLNNCVTQYCKQDLILSACNKALEKTENVTESTKIEPSTPLENIFNEILENEKQEINFDVSRHPYMNQYLQSIDEAKQDKNVESEDDEDNEDDDVIAENDFTPPIDPITKAPIKNPVKNSECGHVYDDESIRALMKNKKTRCPYIGCPSTSYIHTSNLKVDFKLKNEIDNYFLNNHN